MKGGVEVTKRMLRFTGWGFAAVGMVVIVAVAGTFLDSTVQGTRLDSKIETLGPPAVVLYIALAAFALRWLWKKSEY